MGDNGFTAKFGAALLYCDMRACCSISPSLFLPPLRILYVFRTLLVPLQLFSVSLRVSVSHSLSGGRRRRRSFPEKSAFSTNNRSWAIIRKARFKSPVEFAPLPLVQYVNYGLSRSFTRLKSTWNRRTGHRRSIGSNKARLDITVIADERRNW